MDPMEAQIKVAPLPAMAGIPEEPNNTENSEECSRTSSPKLNSGAAAAQMTIFYAGKICVFDSVPAEKAQAIMLVAAAAAAATKATANNSGPPTGCSYTKMPVNMSAAAMGPVLARSLSFLSSSAAALGTQQQGQIAPNSNNSLIKLQAELPIMRRHSLQRFLEKRRDRLASTAPYVKAKFPDGSVEVTSQGNPQPA